VGFDVSSAIRLSARTASPGDCSSMCDNERILVATKFMLAFTAGSLH